MRLEATRTLAAPERDVLLDLWVEAWAAAMPAIDFAARRAWFAAHLGGLMGGGALLLVARHPTDGRPAGFLTLHPDTGAIDQLAVARRDQGQGIAMLLLDEAKRRRPIGLTLTVNAGNHAARALYARAGFVRTGAGTNPRSGLPVLTMRWAPGGA